MEAWTFYMELGKFFNWDAEDGTKDATWSSI